MTDRVYSGKGLRAVDGGRLTGVEGRTEPKSAAFSVHATT